jgi:hypothetical protein
MYVYSGNHTKHIKTVSVGERWHFKVKTFFHIQGVSVLLGESLGVNYTHLNKKKVLYQCMCPSKVQASLNHSGQESMYSKSLCILIVRPCILNVVYIFLTLSIYSYCCLCILIVRPCILIVVYVFLLLSIYSYCSSMYSYRCLCILIVRPCIRIVVYVLLLLSIYSYFSSMYS